MAKEELKCEHCGQPFKTQQALSSHLRHKHPPSDEEGLDEQVVVSKALGKAQPVEMLIRETRLPNIVNGNARIFDAGVEYGMKTILVGVRVAQELSRMGIGQAEPIIRMAKEMQPQAGDIARETGMAMGGEIAGRLFDYLEQKQPKKVETEKKTDPMRNLMSRTMELLMNQLTGQLSGGQLSANPGLSDKRQQEEQVDLASRLTDKRKEGGN